MTSDATCWQCGAELRPGAKFCKTCGTPSGRGPSSPASAPAAGPSVTRPSGDCRECGDQNPAGSRFCRTCGAPIRPAAEPVTEPAARVAPRIPVGAELPAAPVGVSSAALGVPRRVVLAVAVVLALAVGVGTAVALLTTGTHAGAAHRLVAGKPTIIVDPGTNPAANPNPTGSTSSGGPVIDPQQEVGQIQSMLLEHHQDIVQGNFAAAWALTSQRYRNQKLADPGGYAKWVTNQHTLQAYLDPSGIQVSIVSWNAAAKVATVDVTGMRWNAPDAPCTYWEGITWVANVDGQWYYEPGYSLTPQRRAEWQPRAGELLGSSCED